MSRQILLVEPPFKTKFPPMGLMKLSTYHKQLGDNVHFVKGKNNSFVLNEYWDRIYISSVFTYNWKVTVETINYYKDLVHGDIDRVFVGGVLATLMSEELWKETGIVPIKGLLDYPHALDDGNDIIIDNLIPDYRLFDNVQDQYSLINDSYFGYSTKGCVRDCPFCAVPTLEPEFKDNTSIISYINKIIQEFGERRNLVLFDNNIVASPNFEKIIQDILELGFHKGAKYDNKIRHVDFNQGTDARILNDKLLKLISQIAISPLRIAFDFIGLKKVYCEKIRLAAKYGIDRLSNYILYNFKDTPEDLWNRLRINIDLNKELDLKIYSFPMKFIPLDAKDRTYINKPNWNWYFIRGVQRISNVLKGAVMPSEEFFIRAFGESIEEFITILHMPEELLMTRGKFPRPQEITWRNQFNNLSDNEKGELLYLLCENRHPNAIRNAITTTYSQKIKDILEFYIPIDTKNQLIIDFDENFNFIGYNENI